MQIQQWLGSTGHWVRSLAWAGAVWGAAVSLVCGQAPLDFRAGTARVDITPDYPIRLSGFGFRRAESEGVAHRIHARVLALQFRDDPCAVLISVDNCGLPWSMTQALAARLADTSLDDSGLVLASTHTHTAPMVAGVLPTLFGVPIPEEHQANIERYSAELLDALEGAVRAALGTLQPVRLTWHVGEVTFARNRRAADGPVDHDLHALLVRDASGAVLAVQATYACHCVTLSNNLISGDWAGYAAEWIEKEFPGAVGLITIGCGADQNPDSGVTGDRLDRAQQQGAAIGDEIRRLAGLEGTAISGPLQWCQRSIELPLDTPRTIPEWQDRAAQGGAVGYHAERQLQRLATNQPLATAIAYPVQTWKFGDTLALVFLPGEVVVDFSLRLKQEFGRARLAVIAYANDVPCYIPSERVLQEGGYEGEGAMVYYDLPQRLAPGVEERIVGEVHRQLAPEFTPRHRPLWPELSNPSIVPAPHAVLESLQVSTGFRVELVACEPLISDPVAIAFGVEGELWVCQMNDYPTGIDGALAPGGEVRVLRDTDGDGQYDTSALFLDGLPFPTGVLAWRSGALICAAPDILYAEDTDGDGRADRVEKWFSGFETHNYQARVNSLCYGLDGWVYGAGGLYGGLVTSHRSTQPVAVTGRDFRIQPDAGLIEPVSGQTQQGRARNDWGDWFGCDNSNLAWHYPLREQYAARLPSVIPPPGIVPVSTEADPRLLFGISQPTWLPLSGPRNRVTAACGLGVYRDDWLGNDWRGDLFVCEPVGNLVHHLRLSRVGVTYRGARLPRQRSSEFLASSSPWFRPVQAVTGPDGALWIVDMCRWVIEHPRWIPAETLAQLDVRAGEGAGRLFRVVPEGVGLRPPVADAGPFPHDALHALQSPNGCQRDLAMQRLIWHGGDNEAIILALQRLARDREIALAARVQALATLSQLGANVRDDVLSLLMDDLPVYPPILLSFLEEYPEAGPTASRLAMRYLDGPAPWVQQFAWSLGSWQGDAVDQALGAILARRGTDPYLSHAAMSSLRPDNLRGVSEQFLSLADQPVAGQQEPWWPLIELAARQEPVLATQLSLAWLDGVPQREGIERIQRLAALVDFLQERRLGPAAVQEILGAPEMAELLAVARRWLAGDDVSAGDRLAAIRVLGHQGLNAAEDLERLSGLLAPQQPREVQVAALAALQRMDPVVAWGATLKWWDHWTPLVRDEVIGRWLMRADGAERLIVALESGGLAASTLDAARKQQLLTHPNEHWRERARPLLLPSESSDRSAVVADYLDQFSERGDRERGRQVFRSACSGCHVLEGVGHALGPDLAALADRSPAALLESILDPSRKVDARYLQYVAVTDEGLTLTGMLWEESTTALTLVNQHDERHTISRDRLEALRSTQKSMMPDLLENQLSGQDMNDLLSYLAAARSEPKRFPGNEPRVVTGQPDGAYHLLAAHASIYGDEIEFESEPQAIGYWHGDQDYVMWAVEVDRAGQFAVSLEYSCAPDCAGNRVALDLAGHHLVAEVPSTGAWSTFAWLSLGAVELPAGRHLVTVRAEPPLTRRALLDLKSIRWQPIP